MEEVAGFKKKQDQDTLDFISCKNCMFFFSLYHLSYNIKVLYSHPGRIRCTSKIMIEQLVNMGNIIVRYTCIPRSCIYIHTYPHAHAYNIYRYILLCWPLKKLCCNASFAYLLIKV